MTREWKKCSHCGGSGKVFGSRRHGYDGVVARIDWLRNNKTMWKNREINDELAKEIVLMMKAEGLVAPTTYYKDVGIKDKIRRFNLT